MNNEVNVNSGKKVIILVSILFSVIILVIGTTTAYFTQGAGASTDNIVTTDQLSLEFNDEDNQYMLGELIPASRENVIIAYNKTEENKCKDDYGYSACSIYRFTVSNPSNVAQKIKMSLHPTGNSFKNLKFMLYEVADTGNILIKGTTDLIQYNSQPITMAENYTLGTSNDNKEKTFEIVFYIEAQNYDQTGEDSGKQFGAGIRIDSLTTGQYLVEDYGPTCWETEEKDKTKLVKFNGIIHDAAEGQSDINNMCLEYVEKQGDYYIIKKVPSNVGGYEISTIGNNLFNAVDSISNNGPIMNKYQNIKSITIEDGIREIEDGDDKQMIGAFAFIGYGISDDNYYLDVKLSNTLRKIGDLSFTTPSLKLLNIPASVEIIGEFAFQGNLKLTELTFEGATDGTSKLKTIGENAFEFCDLTYETEDNPLILPSSITTMGESVFKNNSKLNYIYFTGSQAGFGSSWNGNAQIIP